MTSEIVGKAYKLSLGALRFKAFAIAEKDVYVGTAKTIDALLGITNRAHVGKPRLSKRTHQGNLEFVGILKPLIMMILNWRR